MNIVKPKMQPIPLSMINQSVAGQIHSTAGGGSIYHIQGGQN